MSSSKVIGFGAIRGKIPEGGHLMNSRTGLEQLNLIRRGASCVSGQVEENFWDRYTSPTINLFNRPQFRNAVDEAKRQGVPLVISDLFKMLGLLGDRDKAVDAYIRITGLGVTIIDGKLGIVATSIPGDALSFMISSAVLTKKNRRIGLKNGGTESRQPTARTIARAKRAVKRHADDFAQRMLPVIEAIRLELGDKASASAIATKLNEERHRTARGKMWQATSVLRVLKRIDQIAPRPALSAVKSDDNDESAGS
ncbi:recombinase family protein [Magnetospirillum moscoviense]|nr:recombinase family protein [Magnetospirillum moscoviense]